MARPANNKTEVWFNPRDSKKDRICYYLRDARQLKHDDLEPLQPHPLAHRKGRFNNMVFLYREPINQSTDIVRDWYGPKNLVDDIINVQDVGGGYQSGLLYARGTEPPTEDYRVPVILDDSLSSSSTPVDFTWDWVLDPDTSLAGVSLVELTINAPATLTGDEVYLQLTEMDTLTDIYSVDLGIYKIVRHVDVSTVQIEVPYDSGVTPSSGIVTGTKHEAAYLLDGYSDTESAPGVLANLFHLRTFSYRLALPSISHPWDDTLGLELARESRLVPGTWARKWDVGYPLAAVGTDERSVGYQPVSIRNANRTIDNILGTPGQDGVEWDGEIRIQVPKILRDLDFSWLYAWGQKGGYLAYDEDWSLQEDSWGPASLPAETRTKRRIVKQADIAATIAAEKLAAGVSEIFTFQPEVYSATIGAAAWWAGENVWARSRVQTFQIGPCLLDGSSMSFGPVTGPSGPAEMANGATNVIQDGDTLVLTASQAPPWGTEVLWEIRTSQARFGFWIVDFIFATLPASPV